MHRKLLAAILILALLMGLIATVVADEPEIVGGVRVGSPRASGIVMDTLAPSDPFVEGLNENETWASVGTYAADVWALEYTPTQNYTFTGGEVILGGGVAEIPLVLYADAGGQPGAVLSTGSFTQVADYGWQGADLSPGVDLTAGTTYWFGFTPINGTEVSTAASGTAVCHAWDYGGDGWDGVTCSYPWMAKFYGVPTGGNPTMHVEDIAGWFDYPHLQMRVLVADEAGVHLGNVFVDATITMPFAEWGRWRYTHPNGWARFWAPTLANGNYEICIEDLVLTGYDYAPGDNVYTCMDWDY